MERTEIERQMELTEKLTKELKPKPSQKSYLELENRKSTLYIIEVLDSKIEQWKLICEATKKFYK